jgi:phosphoribosylformimino-5-aminoimidazole carboxamide ribotide isomerase
MVIENPDEARALIETYTASRIILGIDAMDGIVATNGWEESSGLTAMTVALNAKALGFKRMVYTDIRMDGTMRGMNLPRIKELAQKSGLRITASGGVGSLEDLLRVQELEPFGVDSVVIGRALYQNRFACQALWRMCEARDYPYTAKV